MDENQTIDHDRIIKINIEEEMKSSYIDYSMSVIVARALPDVRDGFKPVHRRILYGMLGIGNTITAIDEQIGYLGRHNRRFDEGVVKVVGHVYCILVQVIHHVFTHFGKAALSITHSCRRVAVYATKVTLTINELIAHIPFLTHSDEGTID